MNSVTLKEISECLEEMTRAINGMKDSECISQAYKDYEYLFWFHLDYLLNNWDKM